MLLVATVVPAVGAATFGPGCGGTAVGETGGSSGGSGGDGGTEDPPDVTVLHPDADPLPGESSCEVTITTGIKIKSAIHVDLCSSVKYATNPPSGGDHWGQWVKFGTYDVPVPREQYVHNLEHGALVLLYKCDGACEDVKEALATVQGVVSGDPLCLKNPDGPKERVVITPDPLLDTPIAIAAWGATYTATCLDPPSLADFAKKHYGKGPEDICPDGSALACTDAGADDAGDGG
jgi:hypothetical protein